MAEQQRELKPFSKLGEYKYPSLPTADAAQALIARVKLLFKKRDEQPFIADDRLQRTTVATLDQIASAPAHGALLQELDASIADWLENDSDHGHKPGHKFIVFPPCDNNAIIELWAQDNGYSLLEAPDRDALIDAKNFEIDIPDGDGLLVIPQLERWFLRHRNGLSKIRALLARLDTLDRKCLIGCNSWAWAFLTKAVDAQMILPDALTFQAFDANRLRNWFADLAIESGEQPITFRLTGSGKDVMQTNDEGEADHDYFTQLAARSLGIPWVAWHLWRRSLHAGIEEQQDGEAERVSLDADEKTVWVAALEEFLLPDSGNESALFVLHALLIHGELSIEELRRVVPLVGESNVLSALISAGFVARADGTITCLPAAYPGGAPRAGRRWFPDG